MDSYQNSLEQRRYLLHKIERLLYEKFRRTRSVRKSTHPSMYGNLPHQGRDKARERAWMDTRSIFYRDEFGDPYKTD